MSDLEKRVEHLETLMAAQETIVSSIVLAMSNVLKELQVLKEELAALVIDVEADGNADAKHIEQIRKYLIRVGKYIHALDAKNTALATVVCRNLGWDPDEMLYEYQRVVNDFESVSELIELSKVDPDET